MFICTDQLERIVKLEQYPPKRIISLVPSQTELLHDLGLDKEVIGITKFCVHPRRWFQTKERVGGTKTVNIEKVNRLQPDLVIANKEENVRDQIEQIKQIAPVWISDVNNFNDALKMIQSVGELVNKKEKASTLISQIETNFLKLQTSDFKPPTCYLIWRNPYMTIGGDTFIGDMLRRCGLKNIFENKSRYPEITIEEISERGAAIILLSSEPFPFKQKHAAEIQSQLPGAKILFADGEMFSWYGSRMLYAAQYFSELMNKIHTLDSNQFFA